MRQLATFPDAASAETLAAFLITQRIDSHAEQERDAWCVWVRDEDKLPAAREILAHYQAHSTDPRYKDSHRAAAVLRREDEQRRSTRMRHVVDVSRNWGGATAGKRCPLVIAMIAASLLIALATEFGKNAQSPVYQMLTFSLPPAAGRLQPDFDPTRELPVISLDRRPSDTWSGVRAGQLWRLITPALLHFGWLHLVCNLWWLFDLGGQFEHRRGTFRFLAFVLATALISNVAQAAISGPYFGGLSGVGYALFGYVWMRVKYGNADKFQLSPSTIFMMLLWFVLCILRDVPAFEPLLRGDIDKDVNVAHAAHAAGLFAGLAIGYAPVVRMKDEG